MSRFYYRDKETGQFIEGFPPRPHNHFGDAPAIITDTIDPYYHPKACITVDSKSALRDLDRACGTITTDKQLPADKSWIEQRTKERHQDMHDCLHRAVAQVDAGTAPLSEETRQLCERQNEITSKALNFDAFNVAGRKKNARGKKYRRR